MNNSEVSKRLSYTFLILMVLIVIRFSIIKFPDDLALQIMSAINAIAVDVVVLSIMSITSKKMIALHEKIGQGKRTHTPDNVHIKRFRRKQTYISVVLIIATVGYVVFTGNSVFNDILTIVALVGSIQDDVITEFLVSKCYQYY